MKKLTQVFLLLTLIALQASAQEPLVRSVDSASLPIRQIMASVRNRNKVLIQWKADSIPQSGYCTLERSTNGIDYDALNIIKYSAGFNKQEFEDEMPAKGLNYYRIKYSGNSSGNILSQVVAVSVAGDISCKFYPNPVDKFLIVRSEEPVEIQLTDSYGKPWVNKKLSSGLQLVDVSFLEKGLYIITLTQKDSRTITEKLYKN